MPSNPKQALYASLAEQLDAMIDGEGDLIARAANTAALLFGSLPDLNWAGFYFLRGEQLVLGPFQGKPACLRIAMGKGVCGTAAVDRRTVIVDDVHKFPGHIACDSCSNSEIVVPIIVDDWLIGVLDLDSPKFGRFDDQDKVGLERIAAIFAAGVEPDDA